MKIKKSTGRKENDMTSNKMFQKCLELQRRRQRAYNNERKRELFRITVSVKVQFNLTFLTKYFNS